MDIEVKFQIDSGLYDIFQIVLKKFNHNEKDIIENYILFYITKQMNKDLDPDVIYPKMVHDKTDYHGKANVRIPSWAHKPFQYNHKIIRSYFKLLNTGNEVSLQNMELLCSDKSNPELYVPTFRSNYTSMKLDNGNNHGKVFEDDGQYVKIAPEVEETLFKFRKYFE